MSEQIREAIRRKQLAYIATFCDDKGKPHANALTVLTDLERFAGVHKGGLAISPVSGMADMHVTAYRNGMRDMVARIHKYIGPTAAKYLEEFSDVS